ncbi:hypothetical protein 12Stean4476_00031 [Erwinia phage Stean]|nr:hypothetical protein 12Stean4476_00031 [Erwinia phage Stean]
MAQRRDPEAQARSFAERYPDNTPVWYYPIKGEDTRRAAWIRSEPWILGHGEVVVKITGVTGCVSIDHIEFRDVRVESHATPELEPASAPPTKPAPVKVADFLQQLYKQLVSADADADTLNLVGAYRDEAATVQEAGLFSDGYHTFNELYAHRVRLFSSLMHSYADRSWWSQQHHDGSTMDGWIIAGIDTPAGPATYHLPESEIPNLPAGTVLERGKLWDGHNSDDVLERLRSLRSLHRLTAEEQEAIDLWTSLRKPSGGIIVQQPDQQDLAIYAYSASVNHPQHTARWDGTIECPRIASHAEYIEARKQISRDGMVADHMTIQIQHLSLVGYTQTAKRAEAPAGQPATLKYTGEGNLYGWGFFDDDGTELDVRDGAIVILPAGTAKAGE